MVASQDLGAAGISCATSESAAGGGMGMDVDLDAVHLREEGMTAAEILMSESQERMLAIVRPEDVDEVLELAAKWEVEASAIGTVTEGDSLRVFQNGELVAAVPAASRSEDAPLLRRPTKRPDHLDAIWADRPQLPAGVDLGEVLLQLLDDPAIGDRSWIYEQYDHQLFLQTVVEPGNDGSLLRIKGTGKGLAVSTDGDSVRCQLDPRRGAERIVYESGLNVAVTGRSRMPSWTTSPSAIRRNPRSCGSSPRRSRGWPRPAKRSGSRWSEGTCPSTTRRTASISLRPRWRACSASATRCHYIHRGSIGPRRE